MNGREVAGTILQLAQVVSGPGFTGGLTWAQWTALRFLARANRFSRTASAFAAFHGTTRGTASQTIKSLIARGHVVRTRSAADGRSARLDLTGTGWAALASDPFEDLVGAAEELPADLRTRAGDALARLIGDIARRRGTQLFGTCGACRHRRELAPGADDAPQCECRLARAALAPNEMAELCIYFDPAQIPMRP